MPLSPSTYGFPDCSGIHFTSHGKGERKAQVEGSCDRFHALGLEDTDHFYLHSVTEYLITRPHLTAKETGKFSVARQLYTQL